MSTIVPLLRPANANAGPGPYELQEAREFAARRIAHNRMIQYGCRALACGASRAAAKFFRAGETVDRAARRAVDAAINIGSDDLPGAA